MKSLIFLPFFVFNFAFSQGDTLFMTRNVRHEIQLGRFWHMNKHFYIHEKDTVFTGEFYPVGFISKLRGSDSTFTGVIASCCEKSEYSNERIARGIMYDETCKCKQYNYYEHGQLRFSEQRGNLHDNRNGIEKHVFESDSSDVFLSLDSSGRLLEKQYIFSSKDRTYETRSDGKGKIFFRSMTYFMGETQYDSIVIDKSGNHTRSGLLVNTYREGNWHFKFNNKVKLSIRYNSHKVQDIDCKSLIFIGLKDEVITKEQFFDLLNSPETNYWKDFDYNTEEYIVPASPELSKKKKSKLLMVRLPLMSD